MMQKTPTLFISLIEESLHLSGIARFKVISNSMFPIIRKGNWIEVKKRSEGDCLHVGEIVLYRKANEFILHRIAQIDQDTYLVKGDRNKLTDPPIDKTSIIGRLSKIKKYNIWFDVEKPTVYFFVCTIGKYLNIKKIYHRY